MGNKMKYEVIMKINNEININEMKIESVSKISASMKAKENNQRKYENNGKRNNGVIIEKK
jgi:hypothetical protein